MIEKLMLVSGYGHNETMKATEDAFFVDKKLFKLNPIEPTFDDHNLMNPWTLKTYVAASGKHQECDVVFAPHFVRDCIDLVCLMHMIRWIRSSSTMLSLI